MSGNRYVLDTNIISFFLKGDSSLLPYFNYTTIHISFVTELELKSIPGSSPKGLEKLAFFLNTCIITAIHSIIKETTVFFRKDYKLKLPDAIIGATVFYLGYELITADKVFNGLPIPITIITR